MPVAHTTVTVDNSYLVDGDKISELASAFLDQSFVLNRSKYGSYRFAHVRTSRLLFGTKFSEFKIGEAGTACVFFDGEDSPLTEVDAASELLLGFLLVLESQHPSIGLTVTTEAPAGFLHAALRVARAYDSSIEMPEWMTDLTSNTLDRGAIPPSLDFRG